MQAVPETAAMLALFSLGGGEIILLLALALILLGAGHLPGLARGLGRGLFEFRAAGKRVRDEIDEEARQAGRSAGGICGAPALQALTPDNHVAERYEPYLPDQKLPRSIKGAMRLWRWIQRFVGAIRGAGGSM
jgi:sec-independent protein translocase protein TatA